jgi:hypothetical protein
VALALRAQRIGDGPCGLRLSQPVHGYCRPGGGVEQQSPDPSKCLGISCRHGVIGDWSGPLVHRPFGLPDKVSLAAIVLVIGGEAQGMGDGAWRGHSVPMRLTRLGAGWFPLSNRLRPVFCVWALPESEPRRPFGTGGRNGEALRDACGRPEYVCDGRCHRSVMGSMFGPAPTKDRAPSSGRRTAPNLATPTGIPAQITPGQLSFINQIEGVPYISTITKGNNAFQPCQNKTTTISGIVPPIYQSRSQFGHNDCDNRSLLNYAPTGPWEPHHPQGLVFSGQLTPQSLCPLGRNCNRSPCP